MISKSNMNWVLLVICALAALTSADKAPALLEQIDGSIEEIAKTVCDERQNVKHQIGRISTIRSLADFMNLKKDGEFKSCTDEYLDSINRLKDVVSVSNENVCSDPKLSLLENFHHDYIATNEDDPSKKPKIPKLLATFFMHYAIQVGITCRVNVIENLDLDMEYFYDTNSPVGGQERYFEKLLNGIVAKFTPLSSIQNSGDVILVWDLIEDSPMAKEYPMIMEPETDSQTGEPVRLLVKTKYTNYVSFMKEQCRTKFRPVYEKLILPMVRISKLGYSVLVPQYERKLSLLSTDFTVKRWYGVTQFCEAILPIQFYKDNSLQPSEFIMISPEEASKLESPVVKMEKVSRYEPKTNSLAHLDEIPLVSYLEIQNLVKSLQDKLSASST